MARFFDSKAVLKVAKLQFPERSQQLLSSVPGNPGAIYTGNPGSFFASPGTKLP